MPAFAFYQLIGGILLARTCPPCLCVVYVFCAFIVILLLPFSISAYLLCPTYTNTLHPVSGSFLAFLAAYATHLATSPCTYTPSFLACNPYAFLLVPRLYTWHAALYFAHMYAACLIPSVLFFLVYELAQNLIPSMAPQCSDQSFFHTIPCFYILSIVRKHAAALATLQNCFRLVLMMCAP